MRSLECETRETARQKKVFILLPSPDPSSFPTSAVFRTRQAATVYHAVRMLNKPGRRRENPRVSETAAQSPRRFRHTRVPPNGEPPGLPAWPGVFALSAMPPNEH
jgi:hypothetical protein